MTVMEASRDPYLRKKSDQGTCQIQSDEVKISRIEVDPGIFS
jgi:hypothetical protein